MAGASGWAKGFALGLGTGATGWAGYYWGLNQREAASPPARLTATQVEAPEDRSGIQKWDSNWDRLSPESLIKPLRGAQARDPEAVAERQAQVQAAQTRSVRRVILIRHGQYDPSGSADHQHHLTPLGFEQAALTGQRLGQLLRDYQERWARDAQGQPQKLKIRLFMSTMTRATETAQTILQHVPDSVEVAQCDMIREGAPIAPVPPICSTLWNPDPQDFLVEGTRIEAAFRRHMHRVHRGEEDVKTIDILVCHGNVIRYFLCRALQLAPDAWLRLGIHNASISILDLSASGRVALRTFGEIGHMPADKMTFN